MGFLFVCLFVWLFNGPSRSMGIKWSHDPTATRPDGLRHITVAELGLYNWLLICACKFLTTHLQNLAEPTNSNILAQKLGNTKTIY